MLKKAAAKGADLPEAPARIPEEVTLYKRTPDWTEDTVPEGLLRAHATKEGVWGRIRVTDGTLLYRVVDPRRLPREWLLSPATDGVIEPAILHEVKPQGRVRFAVEFFR